MIENLARVPVEVDYASEWPLPRSDFGAATMTLLISQSGETADTIAAQREAKAKGSKDPGHLQCGRIHDHARSRGEPSTTHAGPEIGVASTKAFTGQLTALIYSPCIWRRCAAP